MGDQGTLEFDGVSRGKCLLAQEALAAAEKLWRLNDDGAEAAFKETERHAVECTNPELQLRILERSGDFHLSRGRITLAKTKYSTARQNACLLASDGGFEAAERLTYRLTSIEKRDDVSFQHLDRAAQPSHSYAQRNAVWSSWQKEQQESVGRLAARGLGSVEDFRRRLDAPCSSAYDEDGDLEDVR